MKYEHLLEGSVEDYVSRKETGDYNAAWQILLALALRGERSDEVATACYEDIRSSSPILARGALETIGVLLRKKHSISVLKLRESISSMDQRTSLDILVREQLTEIEDWLLELDPNGHRPFEQVPRGAND